MVEIRTQRKFLERRDVGIAQAQRDLKTDTGISIVRQSIYFVRELTGVSQAPFRKNNGCFTHTGILVSQRDKECFVITSIELRQCVKGLNTRFRPPRL